MSNKAFVVDVNWCFGCHTCEVACQMLRGLPPEQTGIKVCKIGAWNYDDNGTEKWQHDYVAMPTDQCDGCSSILGPDEQPTCVKHCMAQCLSMGDLEEMVKVVADKGPKNMLYVIADGE